MSYNVHVYSVLVVSSSQKFNDEIKALLTEKHYEPISFVSSVAAAKRKTVDSFYDFIIINSPLPDDNGSKFAIDISSDKGSVCMMLVKAELYETLNSKVFDHGVYVTVKPTSLAIIYRCLNWMEATRERLRKFEKQTVSIEEKMQEIRIVNRAKWLLISKLKMTESDAHRYIEKRAMDQCISKAKVATDIIKTYER